jgi:CRP/FNR family transcriptional regulator
MLCLRLREAWLMQKVLSFADAENRVRVVLKHISTQYGTKDNRGTIITLKLTHKDIADYASVSRETVTRFLDKFAKDGEIEFLDNKYLLLKPPFKEKLLSV